ncbi:hypothetical protein PLAN_120164 [Planktothrix rubescens CCAP 1459/22]|uniref:Uncharacterized protein n=1 Tax=Planktothrix rubescens CCAP 1459/22 TaxID=329571 RepID=A0A6J7ZIH1_PLARU|nr:hypothetical protein PLAN_120164 [Planktothrix rubescens NIVA-CYA 18]
MFSFKLIEPRQEIKRFAPAVCGELVVYWFKYAVFNHCIFYWICQPPIPTRSPRKSEHPLGELHPQDG